MTEETVTLRADIGPFMAELENLQGLADGFGRALTQALKSAVVGGRELEDVLRSLALSLAGMALNKALAPLGSLFGSLFQGMFSGLTPFAKGGVFGGVANAPTGFGFAGGLGVMGEAGPEAIMPLARGADGRLGVAAGGAAAPVNVVFNVTATDAGSFRKSEAQVTAMLARAVSRGGRRL